METADTVRYGQRIAVAGVDHSLDDLVGVASDVDRGLDRVRSKAVGVGFDSRHAYPLARIGATRSIQRERVARVSVPIERPDSDCLDKTSRRLTALRHDVEPHLDDTGRVVGCRSLTGTRSRVVPARSRAYRRDDRRDNAATTTSACAATGRTVCGVARQNRRDECVAWHRSIDRDRSSQLGFARVDRLNAAADARTRLAFRFTGSTLYPPATTLSARQLLSKCFAFAPCHIFDAVAAITTTAESRIRAAQARAGDIAVESRARWRQPAPDSGATLISRSAWWQAEYVSRDLVSNECERQRGVSLDAAATHDARIRASGRCALPESADAAAFAFRCLFAARRRVQVAACAASPERPVIARVGIAAAVSIRAHAPTTPVATRLKAVALSA